MSKSKVQHPEQEKTQWVNDLSVTYAGKENKPHKTVKIEGAETHEQLREYVHTARKLLGPGDEKYRNYLAARITFVISDKGQEPGGTHGRTKISFDTSIPGHAIYNSTQLFSYKDEPFMKTGHHTEQVLYAYLSLPVGQSYLLREFKKAEARAVEERTLEPLKKGEKRKIYALVFDMHSSINMCTVPTMQKGMLCSCITATLGMQEIGKNNLREKTATTFKDAGYPISGYNRETGEAIRGKVGLKITTRMSNSSIFEADKMLAKQPNDLKDPAINHHDNELILQKALPPLPNTKITVEHCKRLSKITLLKSSTQTGLPGALDRYIKTIDQKGSIDSIKYLLLSFPQEMIRMNLMEEVFANDILVHKLPKTLSKFVEKHNTASLKDGLYNAFVRVGKFEEAQQGFLIGATLDEENYCARDKFSKAFVCYPDEEGHTLLWGATEGSDKETFNKMVNAAGLNRGEIQEAMNIYGTRELEEFLKNMSISTASSRTR